MNVNSKIRIEWTGKDGRTVKHEVEYLVTPSQSEYERFEEELQKVGREVMAKQANWS